MFTQQRNINESDGKNLKKKIKKKHEEGGKKMAAKMIASRVRLLSFRSAEFHRWGLRSSSNAERLIIFPAIYIEKLDSALIRSGRMDKHIGLSYCNYEAFNVLARNYLGITSHTLFDKIRNLLKKVEITPADVAEKLIPKRMKEDTEASLATLIKALETTAMMKTMITMSEKDEE